MTINVIEQENVRLATDLRRANRRITDLENSVKTLREENTEEFTLIVALAKTVDEIKQKIPFLGDK